LAPRDYTAIFLIRNFIEENPSNTPVKLDTDSGAFRARIGAVAL
jgi:hypothetical protein